MSDKNIQRKRKEEKRIKQEARSTKKMCISCRKFFPISKISFAPDPYSEEINEDTTPVWMCDECRYESMMEI